MEEADRGGVFRVTTWNGPGGGGARVSGRLAAGAAAVLFLAPVAGASIRYRVELLGGLNPNDETYARAVNDSGEVAGESIVSVQPGAGLRASSVGARHVDADQTGCA
jgi:hypothetical protein